MTDFLTLLGHIRDEAAHPLAGAIEALLARQAAGPRGAVRADVSDGEVRLPARIDQQRAQDCSGSYGLLAETWCAARGLACPTISRRFTYTLGRQLAAGVVGQAIADAGAQPALVVEGMRRIGVAPESACPGDGPDVINTQLDFTQLEIAWRVEAIAAVTAAGAARCAALRAALDAAFPLGFGMDLTQGYASVGTSGLYVPAGKVAGGHAQRIVGYRAGAFLVANSWGTTWGQEGFAWLTDEQIGGASCYDFYAYDFSLPFSAAA